MEEPKLWRQKGRPEILNPHNKHYFSSVRTWAGCLHFLSVGLFTCKTGIEKWNVLDHGKIKYDNVCLVPSIESMLKILLIVTTVIVNHILWNFQSKGRGQKPQMKLVGKSGYFLDNSCVGFGFFILLYFFSSLQVILNSVLRNA